MWTQFGGSAVLSFADCIVIASNLAIRLASTASGALSPLEIVTPLALPFKAGRLDSSSCVGDAEFLPAVSDSYSQLFSFFSTRFGVSLQEMVALMGAHTVGRALATETGFQGGWTLHQSSFSTSYYSALLNQPWHPNTAQPAAEWQAGQQIMIKADVEFVITPSSLCPAFNLAATPNAVRCPLNTASLNFIEGFAAVGGWRSWFAEFSSAWTAVTEAQATGLYVPAPATTTSITPPARPAGRNSVALHGPANQHGVGTEYVY